MDGSGIRREEGQRDTPRTVPLGSKYSWLISPHVGHGT
jgi:hypothetical protein